jgi:hypothetical protein
VTPKTPRKFTILDGMILVAAVAGAFGLHRTVVDAREKHGHISYVEDGIESIASRAIEAEFPLLVTLTPALLIMRLRRRRPQWLRLARQPGMAASCAAMIPIATSLIDLGQAAWNLEHPDGLFGELFLSIPPVRVLYGGYGSAVGLWVLGAWLILGVSGRRRPEKSWIDRLGRVVGAGWLSILAINALVFIVRWWG